MMLFFPIAAVLAVDEAQGPIEQIATQFGVNWPSLLAQVLNFCILAFLLYRFAVKPILRTLDARQQQIADGLKYADDMKVALAKTEEQCSDLLKKASYEAKKIIDKAEESAETYMQNVVHQARLSSEDLLKKAHADIERERKQMMEDIRHSTVELVLKTTEAVLATQLSQEERVKFQETSLKMLVH